MIAFEEWYRKYYGGDFLGKKESEKAWKAALEWVIKEHETRISNEGINLIKQELSP